MSRIDTWGRLGLCVALAAGLAGCSKSGMNSQSGAEPNNKPMSQEMGKSYVKEIPPEEMQRRESEMTSPESAKKGPAVGEFTGSGPAYPVENQNHPMNRNMGKSYMKELTPEQVHQKEMEMTNPASVKKGPAMGEIQVKPSAEKR